MNNLEKNTFAKEQLLIATIKLLQTKNISEISVCELVNLAQVGRATFYRNYKSINDVLIKHEEFLESEFAKDYQNIENKNIVTFLYELSKHYVNNKEFYITLHKQHLTEIIGKTIGKHIKEQITPKNIVEKYGLNFLIFGLYGWILAWLDDDMKSKPDELLTIMEKYYSDPFDIKNQKD